MISFKKQIEDHFKKTIYEADVRSASTRMAYVKAIADRIKQVSDYGVNSAYFSYDKYQKTWVEEIILVLLEMGYKVFPQILEPEGKFKIYWNCPND